MSEAQGVMLEFIFVRDPGIELETGLVLAGQLVTKFPKWRAPRAREKAAIPQIVNGLLREARMGRMPDDAVVYVWPNGATPPNAGEIPLARDALERWAATHVVVAVRVDSGSAQSGIKIDSDLARQLGHTFSEH